MLSNVSFLKLSTPAALRAHTTKGLRIFGIASTFAKSAKIENKIPIVGINLGPGHSLSLRGVWSNLSTYCLSNAKHVNVPSANPAGVVASPSL